MKDSKNNTKKMQDKIKIITFPVKLIEGEVSKSITIKTSDSSKASKEKILNQALKLHSEGKLEEAAKYYEYFLSQGFSNPEVLSNYGSILKVLGNSKQAEILLRRAIELKPDFANAYSNLGNILRDLGNLKEAESSLRKAIELKPDFANAYSNLGMIQNDLGNLKEAESSLRKAIEMKPDFANAYSNLGMILNDLGNLKEAESSLRKAIELKPDFANAYSNLGMILNDLRKFKEAESSLRKAIEFKPDFANAYTNLGSILISLGKLKQAEEYILKSIEINPNLATAYYVLSNLKYSDKNKKWQTNLFSDSILNNKTPKEKVDIYFARSNILHKQKRYSESSKFLSLANKIKLSLYPSKSSLLIHKSKELMVESNNASFNLNEHSKSILSIFIVGMFRSGSTLLESILSMNKEINDLGENNLLEESYLEWKGLGKRENRLNHADLYHKKLNKLIKNSSIITNKWLYNYQYTGIIVKNIPNCKIIHSYRNPLDNILSMYRSNFAKGSEYSSSLVDCARVYLDQEEIMMEYKKKYRGKIYDLNYDLLVTNPDKEIKALISWLGWNWDDSYLSPHLSPRSVTTASNVQVRSPINTNSIGGWKKYSEILKPVIEIISNTEKYKYLII